MKTKITLLLTLAFIQSLGAQDGQNEAQRLFYLGETDQAAIVADSLLSRQPDDGALLFLKARIEMARQRYAQALPALQQLVDQDSLHLDAFSALGQVYQELGQIPEAISALREAVLIAPDRSDLILKLAALYNKRNAFLTVSALLRPLARHETQNPLVFSLLAQSLIKQENYPEAAYWSRKGLALDSLSYANLLNLGIALFEKGASDSALAPLRKATAVSPQSDGAHYYLGEALIKQQDLENGIKEHEICLEIGGAYKMKSMKTLPKYYYNIQNLEACVQTAEQYLTQVPDEAFVYHFKGRAEADLGLLDQAATSFQKTLLFSNQDFIKMTYFYDALNAFQGERFGQAISGYKTVLALDRQFPYAYYNLAIAYDRYYEDKEPALRYYRRFIELSKTQDVEAAFVETAKNRIETLKAQSFLKTPAQ